MHGLRFQDEKPPSPLSSSVIYFWGACAHWSACSVGETCMEIATDCQQILEIATSSAE